MNKAEWITERFPPVELISLRGEPDFYGASYLIAAQTKRAVPPDSRVGTWAHGWHFVRPIINPLQLVSYGDVNDVHLVMNDKHAQILGTFGYKNVVVVGAPYIYVEKMKIERRPGSLLVMPAHSLSYTQHEWNMDQYAQEIAAIQSRFSCVVACISASCVKNGYWTHAFEKVGIPWISGAQIDDKNALRRMKILFNSFEYLTSHTVGSHIAYGAYAGCKISLYGQYVAWTEKDGKGEPFYEQHPEILRVNAEGASEAVIRARFSDLFLEPDQAVEKRAWGGAEVGAGCKRSARKMAQLLGWVPSNGLWAKLKPRLGNLKRAVARKILPNSRNV